MTSSPLTPANQITILRLVFIPIFAILVVGRHYAGALAVLIAAALSDVLDGTIARVFQQETPLGMALDPIADKVLMTTAYLALAFRGILPWWLTILVISRDVGILATALLISLVSGYRPFRPSVLGKASTAVQVATVFIACGFAAQIPLLTRAWVRTFVYIAAALTVASGVHYLVICGQRYSHRAAEQVVATGNIDQANRPEPSANILSPTKSPSRGPS
jgi:cardiolipin synthase